MRSSCVLKLLDSFNNFPRQVTLLCCTSSDACRHTSLENVVDALPTGLAKDVQELALELLEDTSLEDDGGADSGEPGRHTDGRLVRLEDLVESLRVLTS